jgi:hypothetical protein
MSTIRMPSDSGGPDDLVYIFKVGLDTVSGRVRGQGPAWELLDLGTNSWSSSTEVLPSLLNNAVWEDWQMILAHDPADTQGTFLGVAQSTSIFGVGTIDEHSDTCGLKFDGVTKICKRWTGGTQYSQFDATRVNVKTLWGQWGNAYGPSGFDYDPESQTGLLVGQWAPGDMHHGVLLAPYRVDHGAGWTSGRSGPCRGGRLATAGTTYVCRCRPRGTTGPTKAGRGGLGITLPPERIRLFPSGMPSTWRTSTQWSRASPGSASRYPGLTAIF